MNWTKARQVGATLALVAALALAPRLIWRMQSLPPLDLPTVHKVAAALDAEIERTHGPMIGERFEREWPRFSRKLSGLAIPRLWEALEVKACEAERFDPKAGEFEAEFGETFDEWDALARAGLWEVPSAAMLADGAPRASAFEARSTQRFGMISRLASLELALGVGAARRGDWGAALRRLTQAARAQDCFRLTIQGSQPEPYEAFQSVLAFDPPEKFERAALAELVELAKTDPARDALSERRQLLLEWESPIAQAAEGQPALMQVYMASGIHSLAELTASRPGLLANPELTAMARRLAERQEPYRFSREGSPPLAAYQPKQGHGYRWTATPAAKIWFLRVVEEEPAPWANAFPPRESIGGLDPWTWGLLNRPNRIEALDRAMHSHHVRRLGLADATRAAYAARVWRRERGDWPTDAKALAEAYLPGFDKPLTLVAGLPPSAPLDGMRVGWIEVNDSIQETLWRRALPAEYWIRKHPYEWTGAIDEVYSAQPGSTARRGVSVVQAMRHHPKLVESVDLWFPGEKEDEWVRVDDELARRVEIEGNDLAPRWRLTAKLRAPEKVFAIRVPGPDGKDHGGALAFNPLRDGLAGEIMVFPEGF